MLNIHSKQIRTQLHKPQHVLPLICSLTTHYKLKVPILQEEIVLGNLISPIVAVWNASSNPRPKGGAANSPPAPPSQICKMMGSFMQLPTPFQRFPARRIQ